MNERKTIKVTARQVNTAANELMQRAGFESLARKYQRMAVKGACENKGFVELKDDDVILGVIKSLEKKE